MKEYEPRVGHWSGAMLLQYAQTKGGITTPNVWIERLRSVMPLGHVFYLAQAEDRERQRLADLYFGKTTSRST